MVNVLVLFTAEQRVRQALQLLRSENHRRLSAGQISPAVTAAYFFESIATGGQSDVDGFFPQPQASEVGGKECFVVKQFENGGFPKPKNCGGGREAAQASCECRAMQRVGTARRIR